MARSPQEVASSAAVTESADEFEKDIDKYLDNNATDFTGSIRIPLGLMPGAAVCEELIRRYRNAGWTKVVFESDQREGSSLTLSV